VNVDPTRGELRVIPVLGIGEVRAGQQLSDVIADAVGDLQDGDVAVVTQKIVSKAEGCLAAIDPDDPLAHKKLVEAEAVRVLRRRGDLVMTETRHGFVCANAGVDLSNVEPGWAALLPLDPNRSARRIRRSLTDRRSGALSPIASRHVLGHRTSLNSSWRSSRKRNWRWPGGTQGCADSITTADTGMVDQ